MRERGESPDPLFQWNSLQAIEETIREEQAKIEKEISIDLQKDKGTVNSSICFALDQAATAATLCQHRQWRPRPSASDVLPNKVPAVGLVLKSDGPVAPRPRANPPRQ
ncbi:hypothetical protein VPH35_110833 [Triticum aestivum]